MTEKLKPTVRTSGGNPTGFPNYRPINKLPEHEIKQLMKKAIKPALYQVRVEDRKKGEIAVGPKCPQSAASALAFAISDMVARGLEPDWSNPRVVLAL